MDRRRPQIGLVIDWPFPLSLSFFFSFLLIFVIVSVLLGVYFSVSVFPGHFRAPSYTCWYLPCRVKKLGTISQTPARVPPGFYQPEVAARTRVCVSRLWELSLPGPWLPVGWFRPGIRSGEHWLHKDVEPPRPAAFLLAGGWAGRRGLCNTEVTEVGHARVGNHPASVCGGRWGGGGPRSPLPRDSLSPLPITGSLAEIDALAPPPSTRCS